MILVLLILPMGVGNFSFQTFNDVPPSHPYYAEIEECAARNIVIGYPDGNYYPNAPLLRAGAVVMLQHAAFNSFEPLECTETAFEDVDDEDYYCGWVEDFKERGITNGCGNNLFCPYDNITRGQMAVFIIRSKGEFSPPEPATQRFTDVPPTHPFYAFIDRLVELGISNGCAPDLFCPEDTISRGQAAAFMVRAWPAQ
jgi:endo-1,4-beta-xylanase